MVLKLQDKYQIMAMHQYRRPHKSISEGKFIDRFIKPLGVASDDFGNLYKIILNPDESYPKILWSAHTDSVHTFGGTQEVVSVKGILRLPLGSPSNCLGADNAAGVWMLTEMIKAKIPGLYVFHRLEERGGQGAEFFLKNHQALLAGIEAAIAFDRKGKKSIITHQHFSRSASDKFAKSLAKQLNMGHEPDSGGMFTDTEVYREVISECTNVSVGYENAHWKDENLNMHYLVKLRDAMLKLDLGKLVIERDPAAIELPYWVQNRIGRAVESAPSWKGATSAMTNKQGDLLPFNAEKYKPRGFMDDDVILPPGWDADRDWSPSNSKLVTMKDFMRSYPDEFQDYLESQGFNVDDIRDYVDKVIHGVTPTQVEAAE